MLKPVNTFVLIEQQNNDKTDGGLYLPNEVTNTAANILTEGKVIGEECAINENPALRERNNAVGLNI